MSRWARPAALLQAAVRCRSRGQLEEEERLLRQCLARAERSRQANRRFFRFGAATRRNGGFCLICLLAPLQTAWVVKSLMNATHAARGVEQFTASWRGIRWRLPAGAFRTAMPGASRGFTWHCSAANWDSFRRRCVCVCASHVPHGFHGPEMGKSRNSCQCLLGSGRNGRHLVDTFVRLFFMDGHVTVCRAGWGACVRECLCVCPHLSLRFRVTKDATKGPRFATKGS